MRMSQRSIIPSPGRTGGLGRSPMGLLEPHAIPGVMLYGLSIVHEEVADRKKKEKKKIVQANKWNHDITPSPTRVLPRTQVSPSTLSSKSVLPSSIAEGEGGVP